MRTGLAMALAVLDQVIGRLQERWKGEQMSNDWD